MDSALVSCDLDTNKIRDSKVHGTTTNLRAAMYVESLVSLKRLAGRINPDLTIDCNDKGVLFTKVRVKCNLTDVLKEPKIEEFYKFVGPLPPICPDDLAEDNMVMIGIQLNVFDFGSVALSHCETKQLRSEHVPNPTRVELSSVHIHVEAQHGNLRGHLGYPPAITVERTLVVNLWKRMVPPLSEYSVGNIIWKILICSPTPDNEIDIGSLVSLFRAATEEDIDKIVA
ncbi:hypothetical protein LguiB_004070 [Lonicera macranthoides]